MGLCIKNKVGTTIKVTGIVVKKEGTFDYAGYFDWATVGKATFHGETPSGQTGTALVFPTYKGDDAGYQIENNNTIAPCFHLWGFQKTSSIGQDLKVQIRYTKGGETFTTKSFKIFAPTSKIDPSKKMFDDGYAYNTTLTITGDNVSGGSNGTDWNGGDELENSESGGRTPLDFMAPYSVNKAGTGFAEHHNFPNLPNDAQLELNQYNNVLQPTDVGYHTLEQAENVILKKPFLKNYYIPNKYQMRSILPISDRGPIVTFGGDSNLIPFYEIPQVQNEFGTFASESARELENGKVVVYALRFKGSKWESAWRYHLEGTANQKNMKLIVESVWIRGQNKTFGDIVSPAFFTNNNATKRILPAFGRVQVNHGSILTDRQFGYYWTKSRLLPNDPDYITNIFFREDAVLYGDQHYSGTAMAIRPFYKKLP